MKKNIFIFCLLSSGIINSCAAQHIPQSRIQFRSMIQVGLINGEGGSAFQVQAIHGAAFGTWFAGIGTGLDFYRYRSIPLFADLRKYFGKANSFFIYADAGPDFVWQRDREKRVYTGSDKFTTGFYGDAGIGKRFLLHGNSGILLSISYSRTNLHEKTTTMYSVYDPFNAGGLTTNDNSQYYDYHLNRLLLHVGFLF